jgi:hypothetical protein
VQEKITHFTLSTSQSVPPMEALVGFNPSVTTRAQLLQRRRRIRRTFRVLAVARASSAVELGGGAGGGPELLVEQAGGKRVVELVGAFNELTETMKNALHSSQTETLLFKSLKLSIPILHSLPFSPDGRSPLSKALSLALLLAHLQVFYSSLSLISPTFI